jgi:FtsH-binding integral membrane protein
MLLIRALVAVFLGSRLIWLVTKRWPDSIGKAVFINAVTALAAVIIAAFGFAHGGPPRFNMALSIYGRAQLIVLLFDVIRLIQIKPSTEPR